MKSARRAHRCLFDLTPCDAAVYLLLKCGMQVERATLLLASAKAILRQEAAYGQYAKPEEVMESGNQCAICQVIPFCYASSICYCHDCKDHIGMLRR